MPRKVAPAERYSGRHTECSAFALRSAWVFRHPTVVETKFVGPQWSFNLSVQGIPNLKKRSESATFYDYVRFSDLPSPEERIYKSIHASQRIVEQSILGSLVPVLPVIPERAIWVRRGIRLNTPQVEATIVVTVAVFSGESDTETGLARKS